MAFKLPFIKSAVKTEEKVVEDVAKESTSKKIFDKVLDNLNLNVGFGPNSVGSFASKTLGSLGASITKNLQSQNTDTGVLPNLNTPTRVLKETNPTINTIITQLDRLIKLANKIGVITKKQQEDLLAQISYDRRIAQDSAVESKAAEQIDPEGISVEALEPLNSAFSDLTHSILQLIDIISNSSSNTGNGMPTGGASGGSKAKSPKAGKSNFQSRLKDAKARGSPVKSPTLTGTRNRNITPAELHGGKENIPKMKSPGLTQAKPDLEPKGNDFSKLQLAGNALVVGGLGTAMVDGLSKSKGKAPGESPPNLDQVTKELGTPALDNILGAQALPKLVISGKSSEEAINAILAGNPQNAGVDSLIVPQLSGIPALTDIIARQIYPKVYNGLNAESDPFNGNRLPIIKGSIEKLIRNMLISRIKPVKVENSNKKTDTSAQSKPAEPVKNPTVTNTPTPPPAGNPPSSGTQASATPAASIQPSASATSTGNVISTVTQEVNADSSDMGSSMSPGYTTQATAPTTITGATGIGNVRDPNYYDTPAWIFETI